MIADGHGTALGSSIYPAFTKYFLPELVQKYPYDPAKAQGSCWPQAGYPNGFDMTISVPSNYQPYGHGGGGGRAAACCGRQRHHPAMEWGVWHEQVYKAGTSRPRWWAWMPVP